MDEDKPIFAGTQEALSEVLGTAPPPKRVRKPKAKAKKKKIVKAKPKAKKKVVKKPHKIVRGLKQAIAYAKGDKSKGRVAAISRSERLDLRLTKAEKAKLLAKAKKTRRTITSVMLELIEKIR